MTDILDDVESPCRFPNPVISTEEKMGDELAASEIGDPSSVLFAENHEAYVHPLTNDWFSQPTS